MNDTFGFKFVESKVNAGRFTCNTLLISQGMDAGYSFLKKEKKYEVDPRSVDNKYGYHILSKMHRNKKLFASVTYNKLKQVVIYSGFDDMDELINQLLKERK